MATVVVVITALPMFALDRQASPSSAVLPFLFTAAFVFGAAYYQGKKMTREADGLLKILFSVDNEGLRIGAPGSQQVIDLSDVPRIVVRRRLVSGQLSRFDFYAPEGVFRVPPLESADTFIHAVRRSYPSVSVQERRWFFPTSAYSVHDDGR